VKILEIIEETSEGLDALFADTFVTIYASIKSFI
jgi:hypothetical protein